MRSRVRVFGTTAIVKLISGREGDADSGLFLRGPTQCFDLADALIDAGLAIAEAEKKAKVPPDPGFYRSRRRNMV